MRRINYIHHFATLKYLLLPLLACVLIISISSIPNLNTPKNQSASLIANAYSNTDIGNDVQAWHQKANLEFIENRGQIIDTDGNPRSDIAYVADGNGVTLYFTSTCVSYVFTKIEKSETKNVSKLDSDFRKFERDGLEVSQMSTYRIDMKLLDSNPNVRIYAEEETEGYSNYYYAHCPDGILNVKAYKRLIYENIYDNIDLVFYNNKMGMEYDFVVKPGGRVLDIQFYYEGAEKVSVLKNGKLKVVNPLGQIIENEPKTYTIRNNQQMTAKRIHDTVVKSYFRLERNIINFEVSDYDTNQMLLIDPELSWATYYGGGGDDRSSDITTDESDNVVVTGLTSSTNFPVTSGAFQTSRAGNNENDVFIIKFSNSGIRQWATYYGGSAGDVGNSIATDRNGHVVITGTTESEDFPVTSNAFQTSYADPGPTIPLLLQYYSDAFIIKFSSSGIRQWATYYGSNSLDRDWGSARDCGLGVATDAIGNIVVTGYTVNSNFPITNGAFQTSFAGDVDAFIIKFDSYGNRQWTTYFGGSASDEGIDIAIDENRDIVITGDTDSEDFPVSSGAFQTNRAEKTDAFIAKFSSSGSRQWATYFGGNNVDYSNGIATDGNGNVVITGSTWSTNLPVTSDAFQTNYADDYDAFIAKFNSNGSRQWASYYGGTSNDQSNDVATDGNGNIVITGETYSSDFHVTNDAFQAGCTGSDDAFIVKFNSVGSRQWATYYGGNATDYSNSVAMDKNGNVVMTGNTLSTNFPVTLDAFQTSLAGFRNIFMVKFLFNPLSAPTLSSPINGSVDNSTEPILYWNNVSSAESYRLQISIYSDFATLAYDENGITTTSKTITELSDGTKYYWRVNATGDYITTDWSDVWSFTTILLKPEPPYLMSPSDKSIRVSITPTLIWQASDGAESYRLQISNNLNFSTTVFDEIGITETFKKINKLDNDKKYYWRVLGANSKGPSDWSAFWQFTTVPILTLNCTISFPQYEKASDYSAAEYKIVGLPGASDLPVETLQSGNHGTDWQAYWDDGLPSNDPKEYLVEFDNTSTFRFTAGRAFWFIKKGALRIIKDVEAVPLIESRYATLPLHRGWNLITNPFLIPVNWSAVGAMNGSINPIWKYNGVKNFSDTTLFEPYVGYYFFADSSLDTLKIPNPSSLEKLMASTGNSEPDGWKVHVSLSSGNFADNTMSFGVSEQARKGLDKLDFCKPRGIASVPTISFQRAEWDPNYSIFATDIRPEFDKIESWDFEVSGAHQQNSQLDFKGIEQIPEPMEIYLVDEGRGKSVNLREQPSYDFMGIGDIMKFQVVVGQLAAVRDKLNEINIPKKFALGNNYPNPFNPITTIPVEIPFSSNIKLKIYNILGQKIKSLHEGKIEAGRYLFMWDGQDETGNRLSSGVYLLHLNSDTGIALSNKMILLR